jgi:hypothetical protein
MGDFRGSLGSMRWISTHRLLLAERFGEAARESAILWFVFSALDALVSHGLTAIWFTSNTCLAIAVWVFGIYFEVMAKEKR